MSPLYHIATTPPDFSKIPDRSSPCPEIGWPNLVYAVDAGQGDSPRQTGPLSIKMTTRGRESYETEERRHVVDRTSWLVLNEGQAYDHDVLGDRQNVSSFCLFFSSGSPARLMREQVVSEEELLDEPEGSLPAPEFLELVYRCDEGGEGRVGSTLRRMHGEIRERGTIDQIRLAEYYRLLFRELLRLDGIALRELAGISAARHATRVERLRRVRVAREYMLDNFQESLTLEEIAGAAALSPWHFLRTFREAFGQTPHEYLTARRLEHARYLLRETDLPVASICYDVGFESPSSFTSLFRRRVGLTPLSYRAA